MSYRSLQIRFDAYVIDRWNHTAIIACNLFNLQSIVANLGSKARIKYKTPLEFHPYLKKVKVGMKITRENITDLKLIGQALCRK